jgi:hypothetical protein
VEIHHLVKRGVRGEGGVGKLLPFITLASFIAPLTLLPSPLGAVLADGYVVKVDSATVYLDWGKSSGVKEGDQFKIYRAGEPLKHPVTGEILGQTEVDLGQGVLDHLDEKFSSGKLVQSNGTIKGGDRTRLMEPAAAPPPVAAPAPAGPAVPKELWRSDAIGHEAVGVAIGNVEGNGKKDVVVAYRDRVEVFRWNGQKLESAAVFNSKTFDNYLAVETADVDGAGHDKIFATSFVPGVKRSRVVVLEYAQGALHDVGHLGGFIRALEHADGKRVLLSQDLSMSRELRVRQPEPIMVKDGKFKDGEPLKLARALNDDQLFGYAWGDWDGDGSEDFAFLQDGERLRVLFKNGKWSTNEVYGGTKADFDWSDEQVGSVYPRLLNLKTSNGKMQLLVPHNIPATPIRLARLKIYKESELVDLGWDGLQMTPVWKIPVTGELADFALGDVTGTGSPQVWIAAVGAGDKTVLLGYQLP